MRFTILLLVVLTAGCAAHRAPVASGTRADTFSPAPGLFAERDVQYVGNVPHCILRLTMAEGGEAVYAEATMQWCEGVR